MSVISGISGSYVSESSSRRSNRSVDQQSVFSHAPSAISSVSIDVTEADQFLQRKFYFLNSGSSKKTLYAHLKNDYDQFEAIVTKHGVNNHQLEILLDLIFSCKLGGTAIRKVMKLLLPRDMIPARYFIRIFGRLSCRDIIPAVMDILLKWVICVYDMVDDTEEIIKLYPVLFHYLTMESFRPQLCHLLYFMTKRVHVKRHRIERLQELIQKFGAEPELIGLLKVYKSYQPDVEMPRVSLTRKAVFAHPDPELRDTLMQIRTFWRNQLDPSEYGLHRPPVRMANHEVYKRNNKRRRMDQAVIRIPNTETTRQQLDSVTIAHIPDTHELAMMIDKLELPDQMAAVLDNRLLQHVLICCNEETSLVRIGYWLSNTLQNMLRWQTRETSEHSFEFLLDKLVSMARLTRAHLPIVETFLEKYIAVWNGYDNATQIFELLTYVRPLEFQELEESYLKPLYRLFCASNVMWKARLLLCYTSLVKNWVLIDWFSHNERRMDPSLDTDADDMIWLFRGLDFDVEYFATIHHLIQHVDRISALGLVIERDHPVLQHACLSFFELVSTMSLSHDIPEIIIPAAPIIYRSFFSTTGMAMSRICGIIAQYKTAFEENDRKTDDWVARHTTDYLDNFNSYVMDVCSSLWANVSHRRNNPDYIPFSLSPQNYNAFKELAGQRDQSFDLALSLTHSACLAGYSQRFLDEWIDQDGNTDASAHDGPVTPELLKAMGSTLTYSEYCVEFLEHLNELGFSGIYRLLYSTIGSLIDRKKQVSEIRDASDEDEPEQQDENE